MWPRLFRPVLLALFRWKSIRVCWVTQTTFLLLAPTPLQRNRVRQLIVVHVNGFPPLSEMLTPIGMQLCWTANLRATKISKFCKLRLFLSREGLRQRLGEWQIKLSQNPSGHPRGHPHSFHTGPELGRHAEGLERAVAEASGGLCRGRDPPLLEKQSLRAPRRQGKGIWTNIHPRDQWQVVLGPR
jgi:hypothetical protein